MYLYVCPIVFFIKRYLLKAFCCCCYKSRKTYTIVLKFKMSQYWSHILSVNASGGKKNKHFLSNKNDLGMPSNAWEVKWEIQDALPCSKTSSPLKKRYMSDAHAHLTRCWGTSLLQVQPRHFSGIFPSKLIFGPCSAWLRWRLQTWAATPALKHSHCQRWGPWLCNTITNSSLCLMSL